MALAVVRAANVVVWYSTTLKSGFPALRSEFWQSPERTKPTIRCRHSGKISRVVKVLPTFDAFLLAR